MKTRKTILFPTDFSERASHALAEAIPFAKRFNDKLLIYHVFHRPVMEGTTSRTMDSMLRRLSGEVEEEFKNIKKQHPDLAGVDYEFRKELGISTYKIPEMCKTPEVGQIIMATKGASGFGELWGTKTAKIIKSVQVPVLVIPDKGDLKDIKKIGLACDYSDETNYRHLRYLLQVAEELKADVDVITLNRDERMMTREEVANREKIKVILEGVNTTFNFTFSENIEEGIIKYCTSNEIGMISVLPKSYNFIERVFHESLTTKMAFHSPIPLIVLNEK